jgi:hypothetical protein
MKEQITKALLVIREFLWRSFGLFLFVLGAGAGIGGIMGDALNGVLMVFGGALLVAIGWVGYRITITGNVDVKDVADGMRRAAEQVETKKDEDGAK